MPALESADDGAKTEPQWVKKAHFNGLGLSLTPTETARLTDALDKVLSILSEKPIDIVDSKSLQKGYVFAVWERMRELGRRPRRCVFPGCQKTSIRASHALQRNGPLAAIAESGHVMAPSFDLTTCAHSMKRIGVGQASTFPGFCSEHERLFFELETRTGLPTDGDVMRQVFRAICHELVLKRQEYSDLLSYLRVWQFLISMHGWKIIRDTIGPELTDRLKLKQVSTGGTTPLERRLVHEATAVAEHVRYLELVMLPASMGEIEGREPGLAHMVFRIQQCVPLCLSGLGNFCVQAGDTVEPVSAIINVWPTANNVSIVMSTERRHEHLLQDYFYSRLSRSLGPLEMMETWMTNGTNHWFIPPSVWRNIPAARAQRILTHFGERDHNLGSPYHLSIFDDIRRALMREGGSGCDLSVEEKKLTA